MAVRRIDCDDIYFRFDERGNAIHCIRRSSYRRAGKQPAVLVARGIGVLNALFDIFDRDQTFQVTVFINDGKFLDPVFSENFLRVRKRRSDRRGNEVVLRHHVFDRLFKIRLETQIAIRQNADEFSLFRNGHAADAVTLHQRNRVFDQMLRFEIERIGNDAVFAAFYFIDLFRLFLDAHIFMNDPHSAFARHGDRKTAFCNRIHCGGNDRNIQRNPLRKHRTQIHFRRHYGRCLRNEKHVVKR